MRTYEKTCATKTRYPSRRFARKGRRFASGMGQIHLHIYRCPYCDWFHLGHLPKAITSGLLDKTLWETSR